MTDTQWPAHKVRKTFFDFFEERRHTIGKSLLRPPRPSRAPPAPPR